MKVSYILGQINSRLARNGLAPTTDQFHSLSGKARSLGTVHKVIQGIRSSASSRAPEVNWLDVNLPAHQGCWFLGWGLLGSKKGLVEVGSSCVNIPSLDEFPTPKGRDAFQYPDYKAIADSIPLDDKDPPIPTDFKKKRKGAETISTPVALFIYSQLVGKHLSRKEREDLTSNSVIDPFIRKFSRAAREQGYTNVSIIDSTVKLFLPSEDFDFGYPDDREKSYFLMATSADYRTHIEYRGYITLDESEIENLPGNFVDLCNELHERGISHLAKAVSPLGIKKKKESIVIYTHEANKEATEEVVANWIRSKGIKVIENDIGAKSETDGFSWAPSYTYEEASFATHVTGNSDDPSFNEYVATRVLPYYLLRLIDAHEKQGNHLVAKTYEDELTRICGFDPFGD